MLQIWLYITKYLWRSCWSTSYEACLLPSGANALCCDFAYCHYERWEEQAGLQSPCASPTAWLTSTLPPKAVAARTGPAESLLLVLIDRKNWLNLECLHFIDKPPRYLTPLPSICCLTVGGRKAISKVYGSHPSACIFFSHLFVLWGRQCFLLQVYTRLDAMGPWLWSTALD